MKAGRVHAQGNDGKEEGDDACDDAAYAAGHRMRESLAATGVTTRHCLDLIRAFKTDATKLRYRDWQDLIGYCVLSAAPVGRYLLDLHGERRDNYVQSDALCNALQVINHLQDCKDDYLTLDRVYLPEPWLVEAGAGVADLGAARASPGLRRTTTSGVSSNDPVAISTKERRGVGCPSKSDSSFRSRRSSDGSRYPASAHAAYNSGAACPLDNTNRSLSEFRGSVGS